MKCLPSISTGGNNAYGGERINQLEHALQTATLAEQAGADASSIVASLLHDDGHLIHNFGTDDFKRGIDDVNWLRVSA
jgi:predicted HD phosphohydrolase